MPSIMDIIKQRKQAAGTTPASAQTIAEQQQTAATGKVGRGAGGPAMSNLGAQLAAQQTQAQQAQLATQGAMQEQALRATEQQQTQRFQLGQAQQAQQFGQAKADIAAQTEMSDAQRQAQDDMAVKAMASRENQVMSQMSNAYSNSLRDLASQRGIAEQDIFMEARRMRDELSFDKYQAFLDQSGHVLAMTNQEYVDNMRRIGQERRLQDQLQFRREATEIAFGQDLEFLSQQFDQSALMNADRREFEKMMASMDIDTAMRMAEQASKEAAYKNMIMGGTGVATGILTADDKKSRYSEKPTSTLEQELEQEVYG